MERSAEHDAARRRATAKYGFFVHAMIYGAVMVLLVAINLITAPGTWWFIWPLMGWGLAVALHAGRVFLMPDRNAIIDAMVEHELQRSSDERRSGS